MKAAIFDFDGTIMDTESLWFEVYSNILKNRYGYTLTLKSFAQVIGTVNDVLTKQLEEEIGEDFDREWLRKKAEEEFQNRQSELVVREGVSDLIHYLVDQNSKLAIASSSTLKWVQTYLIKEKLTDYFPVILTSEFVSKVKPDPELYLKALEKLELDASEVIAIEDSGHGSEAALNAGIQTFVVPNPVTANLEFPPEAKKFNNFYELRKELGRRIE